MKDVIDSSMKIALLSPALGTGNIGDYFIERAICRLLKKDVVYQRFNIREPMSKDSINKINSNDYALLCGTNLYQRDWHSSLTPKIVDQLRIPLIPFGVGSSAAKPEDLEVSKLTQLMIQAVHEKCILGSVRDPHTVQVVTKIGVKNIALTGCPVLFWAGKDHLPPIQPIKRRRVVITARNWLMHQWSHNVDHPVQVNFLRKIFKVFLSHQLLFALHESYDANLVDILQIPRKNVFQSDDAEDYIRLYQNQENVILAMRLHAGMLGIANGVPAVFVAHDTRTYSFCDMMGLEYVDLFDETCAEQCIHRLQKILGGDVSAFNSLTMRYHPLRQSMTHFLTVNKLAPRSENTFNTSA